MDYLDFPVPEVRQSSGRVTLSLDNFQAEIAANPFLPSIPDGFQRKSLDVTSQIVGDQFVVDWAVRDVERGWSP